MLAGVNAPESQLNSGGSKQDDSIDSNRTGGEHDNTEHLDVSHPNLAVNGVLKEPSIRSEVQH